MTLTFLHDRLANAVILFMLIAGDVGAVLVLSTQGYGA